MICFSDCLRAHKPPFHLQIHLRQSTNGKRPTLFHRTGRMETFLLKLRELKSISAIGVAAIALCDHNLGALYFFHRSKQSPAQNSRGSLAIGKRGSQREPIPVTHDNFFKFIFKLRATLFVLSASMRLNFVDIGHSYRIQLCKAMTIIFYGVGNMFHSFRSQNSEIRQRM